MSSMTHALSLFPVLFSPHPPSTTTTNLIFPSPHPKARLREEERLAKLGDNARERALESMMGGVLEVKKEDELKKDVPPPPFVAEAKPEDEWSEEEQRLFKEFEKKVKDLAEEREKFKKQLETELKKVQASVVESVQQFDELHTKLFLKKVKTEMVIAHEEMKILRLRKMLLTG